MPKYSFPIFWKKYIGFIFICFTNEIFLHFYLLNLDVFAAQFWKLSRSSKGCCAVGAYITPWGGEECSPNEVRRSAPTWDNFRHWVRCERSECLTQLSDMLNKVQGKSCRRYYRRLSRSQRLIAFSIRISRVALGVMLRSCSIKRSATSRSFPIFASSSW